MKVLEEIKKEHDEVRDLILQIENHEEQAEELFKEMVLAVLGHHDAEEQVVFEKLPEEKDAQELKLELIAEHASLRRGMQVVLDTEPEDENWKARFKVVKEVFNHHIHEEEKELFEKLRGEYEESELEAMYEAFETAEEEAKKEVEMMLEENMILRSEHILPQSYFEYEEYEEEDEEGMEGQGTEKMEGEMKEKAPKSEPKKPTTPKTSKSPKTSKKK